MNGNNCGHLPTEPRWFEAPGQHTRPHIIKKLIASIQDYYKEPTATLPSLSRQLVVQALQLGQYHDGNNQPIDGDTFSQTDQNDHATHQFRFFRDCRNSSGPYLANGIGGSDA